MILLRKGQVSQEMIVTLNEKRTLENGYYLFVFTHIETKTVVSKIYSFLDDNSSYQDRYNSFNINTSTLFDSLPRGQWNYDVYEQASAINTDVTGLNKVENGIMKLSAADAFAFEEYENETTYKVYGG